MAVMIGKRRLSRLIYAVWTGALLAVEPGASAYAATPLVCHAVEARMVGDEFRIALVIGNSAYREEDNFRPLPSSENDASGMEKMLRAVGFAVIRGQDLDYNQMLDCVSLLNKSVNSATGNEQYKNKVKALIYFSGHGIETGGINGENYLIPINARLPDDDMKLSSSLLSLQFVLNNLGRSKSRTNLVIIDACRSNPFVKGWDASKGQEKIGFDEVKPSQGTLVAFASWPGTSASPSGGPGGTSIFTGKLLENFNVPGATLSDVLVKTTEDVKDATNEKQIPWLGGDATLLKRVVLRPAQPIPPEDEAAWVRAQSENTSAAYRRYKQDYPKGAHLIEAQAAANAVERVQPQTVPISPPISAPQSIPAAPPANLSPVDRVVGQIDANPAAKTESMAPAQSGPAAWTPGTVFRDCPGCPEMVVIPAGRFMMGSPPGEPGRSSNEGPQHQVTFAKPFAAGKYSVTFAEWDACVADGGCNHYKPSDQGWGRGRRPVINVSWDDAHAYIDWLNKKLGANIYRLLSEAEREYVTRAGTTTPFWFGDTIRTDQVNYNGVIKGMDRSQTVEVGTLGRANPFGLWDVHGNVREWVEDCWHEDYDGAPPDGSVWTTESCNERIVRGGSWSFIASITRAANRSGIATDNRCYLNGFRLARMLP